MNDQPNPDAVAQAAAEAAAAQRCAEVAEVWGLHAVQAALRPIWLPKRPAEFNEAELATSSGTLGPSKMSISNRGGPK